MKINANNLSLVQLNYLVAICEGYEPRIIKNKIFIDGSCDRSIECNYSSDWRQAGPIKGREKINVDYCVDSKNNPYVHCFIWAEGGASYDVEGETELEASMRCFVISKMGWNVEIPTDIESL